MAFRELHSYLVRFCFVRAISLAVWGLGVLGPVLPTGDLSTNPLGCFRRINSSDLIQVFTNQLDLSLTFNYTIHMAHYLTLDAYNCFFRSIHAAHRGADAEEKMAFALHCTIQSIGAAWRDLKGDHIVVCLEGRSWRKDFYPPYKADRVVKRAARTETEKEEEALMFEGLTALIDFLTTKTNVTVLQHERLEADDLIGGWIQTHPNDTHTIISSDTDYYQLLAPNVNQFNGISQELHTIDGIFDKKGKRVIDKKTKLPKLIPDPKFILFEKCVRGDPTDNIFSAYPGVRAKSSKNKVGLQEAFEDKTAKGFAWNNLMLQRWVDHNGVEHKVIDDYNRNVVLVDLTAQPQDVRDCIYETISNAATALNRPMVGAQFLKFCGKFDLAKLSENATTYGAMLSAGYTPQAETFFKLSNGVQSAITID